MKPATLFYGTPRKEIDGSPLVNAEMIAQMKTNYVTSALINLTLKNSNS